MSLGSRRSLFSVATAGAIALTAPSIAAQPLELPASLSPGTRELNAAAPVPWMAAECRLQVLFAGSEIGATGPVPVRRLSLRFDGPSAGPASRSHTVQHLSLRLGTTAIGVGDAGSAFAANLSSPLAVVIADRRVDYLTDASAVTGPEPFGGPGGRLSLPFDQATVLPLVAAGAVVVELTAIGNDNAGDAALLDLHLDPSNFTGSGSAVTNGRGCPVGANLSSPVLETTGVYEPGGSFVIHGSGFLPLAPTITVITAGLFASPLAFAFTNPICWDYVDVGTTILQLSALTTATGDLPGGEPLPLPKRPAPAGPKLYVQTVTLAQVHAGNGLGLASSNYRTIQVGLQKSSAVAAWTAWHAGAATAPVASVAFWGAPAMRLE